MAPRPTIVDDDDFLYFSDGEERGRRRGRYSPSLHVRFTSSTRGGSLDRGYVYSPDRNRSRDRSLDRVTRDSLMSGALRHGPRLSCEHGRTGECWECRFAGDFEEDRGRSMVRHSGTRWNALSPSPNRDRSLEVYRYSRWDHPSACGNSSYYRRGERMRSRSRSRSRGQGSSWWERSRSRSRSRSLSVSPYRRSARISNTNNNININLSQGGGIWHRKDRHKRRGRRGYRSRSRSWSGERGWRGDWRGDNRGVIIQDFRRRYPHW